MDTTFHVGNFGEFIAARYEALTVGNAGSIVCLVRLFGGFFKLTDELTKIKVLARFGLFA